jgi:hypothetical protein
VYDDDYDPLNLAKFDAHKFSSTPIQYKIVFEFAKLKITNTVIELICKI